MPATSNRGRAKPWWTSFITTDSQNWREAILPRVLHFSENKQFPSVWNRIRHAIACIKGWRFAFSIAHSYLLKGALFRCVLSAAEADTVKGIKRWKQTTLWPRKRTPGCNPVSSWNLLALSQIPPPAHVFHKMWLLTLSQLWGWALQGGWRKLSPSCWIHGPAGEADAQFQLQSGGLSSSSGKAATFRKSGKGSQRVGL